MFRVFSCLMEEHDWRLAVLAGLVCLLASLVAASLYHRSRAPPAGLRAHHGVATGCGIWATYFIATAACEPTVAANGAWTAVSLMIATIVAVAALARWARARFLEMYKLKRAGAAAS